METKRGLCCRTRASDRGTLGKLLSFALLAVPAPAALAVTVTVQTTDCVGGTGIASFQSERLYTIQEGHCPDPNDPSKKLKQVLLKSDGRVTNYELVWVTEAESQSILAQVKRISEAELTNLERADIVVERRDITRVVPSGTSTTRSSTPIEGAPPLIKISDPPIVATRSVTSVITAPDTEHRTVVGRVTAPAGLMSLTINGEQHAVNDNGVFTGTVAITRTRTPVTIVAVDNEGQSATVEFRLVREAPQQEQQAQQDSNKEEVFGRYHALVIANNHYRSLDDLVTPANDANAISEILERQYGFEVTKLFNATRYDMVSALNDMRRDLTDNDNLLIYFAGHGAYDKANNRGHWLPVDAEHDSTANWVSTIDVTDIVNAMSAKHVLVVADSCYSGALMRAENTELDPGMSDDLRSQWLRAMAKTRSRYLLTSGGVKPIVDDGGNGHSVFANALIEVLSDGSGVIESSVLYRRVRDLVTQRSQVLELDQTPDYAQLRSSGHEFGEFLLVVRR